MHFLGIDVGSLYVGIVLLDADGRIMRSAYERHRGEPLKAARRLLADFPLDGVVNVARTGSGGEDLVALGGDYIDAVVAGVEGVKSAVPGARNIIQIGGGSFSLTQLAEDGGYQHSSINSACASGTGAFLDQQSHRLQVPPAELGERAMRYDKRPPAVATRCAVFAKSDMIHLQQEGFTVDAIAAGLCAGLGNSTVDGLLGGRTLTGKTAVIGGVAINPVVVGAVREKLGVEVVVPERPHLIGAFGAARVASERHNPRDEPARIALADEPARKTGRFGKLAADPATLRPPLELKLSAYPDFSWHESWVDADGSEIAVVEPRSGTVRVTMGIDIGSTSTKAAFLGDDEKMVGWIYRKTAGNPIRAVQLLFKAARELEARGGFKFDVRGVGTTGSGRKMIGALIGADLATNEITAHAAAAAFIDPEVDTIIELGGQDAKFTQLQNGMVYNSVMNYVCAAGTGSFIEEQALKLGIPLDEYAGRAMGKACPLTSDRCTVYMERDLDLLLARGWEKDAVAAAVLHSVRDNYLNKVVGGLYIGDHVYFQGATARNKALVAAFEVELGKPIRVSPYCHLTGSLGMCLLVADRVPEAERSKNFKGLGFADARVEVDYETCELCHNRCNLSLIRTGGGTLAWGLKCGRDYGDKKVKVRDNPDFEWWRKRQGAWLSLEKGKGPTARSRGRIGILRSLGVYGYYPFWKRFVEGLGYTPVTASGTGDGAMATGAALAAAEYCAPVVASHGHAAELLNGDKVEWLLAPHLLREPVKPGFTDAHFCCYVQSHPGVLRSVAGLRRKDRILSPIVQFNRPDAEQIAALRRGLLPLGVDDDAIARALGEARAAQDAFRAEALRLGAEALSALERGDGMGLVCIGRPYNSVDPGLTLDLPRKMAALGYPVLYLDMLPYDLRDILPEFANMYWHYGQKILATASFVAKHPRLFGVYFTNFMCGPDSYILTYFKEIMGRAGKPYLCLQFDGHGADAGYLTRVEAALESFHAWSKIPRRRAADTADRDRPTA
ncbi:MAG: acyl-CoA dehydratase activase [Planctomycetota bacterium]|jgi:predicted CoA-substrate-specific enzyme activase|nr:acyl-CoA dehydratase activase [Planctomycetota bacterium]